MVVEDTKATIEGKISSVSDETYDSHDVTLDDTSDYGKSLIFFIIRDIPFVTKGAKIRVTVEKIE